MAEKVVPIKLDNLTANNLGIFNRITDPVEYPEHYIKQCKDSDDLSKYAYFSEVPVGVLVLQSVVNKSPVALNISLLKVLSSYSWKYNVEREFLNYAINLCPKRHVNTCVMIIEKNNNKLAHLLVDLGFHTDTPDKEIYKTLTVSPDSVLYAKSV